jgi:hypothetical protein
MYHTLGWIIKTYYKLGVEEEVVTSVSSGGKEAVVCSSYNTYFGHITMG